jgi:hypothetical protein
MDVGLRRLQSSNEKVQVSESHPENDNKALNNKTTIENETVEPFLANDLTANHAGHGASDCA